MSRLGDVHLYSLYEDFLGQTAYLPVSRISGFGCRPSAGAKLIGSGKSVHRLEEFSGPNLQSLSQLDDVEQAHVPLPPLYPAHVVPMQVS